MPTGRVPGAGYTQPRRFHRPKSTVRSCAAQVLALFCHVVFEAELRWFGGSRPESGRPASVSRCRSARIGRLVAPGRHQRAARRETRRWRAGPRGPRAPPAPGCSGVRPSRIRRGRDHHHRPRSVQQRMGAPHLALLRDVRWSSPNRAFCIQAAATRSEDGERDPRANLTRTRRSNGLYGPGHKAPALYISRTSCRLLSKRAT
jgi:hypothetical protein